MPKFKITAENNQSILCKIEMEVSVKVNRKTDSSDDNIVEYSLKRFQKTIKEAMEKVYSRHVITIEEISPGEQQKQTSIFDTVGFKSTK